MLEIESRHLTWVGPKSYPAPFLDNFDDVREVWSEHFIQPQRVAGNNIRNIT